MGLHFVLELLLSERPCIIRSDKLAFFLEASSRNPPGTELRRIGGAAQVKVEISEISGFIVSVILVLHTNTKLFFKTVQRKPVSALLLLDMAPVNSREAVRSPCLANG